MSPTILALLIYFIEEISQAPDDCNIGCGISGALQKAFHTVNHEIQLNHCGISKDWLRSYFFSLAANSIYQQIQLQ